MSSAWESALYHNHGLVALDPLGGSVELLNFCVKKLQTRRGGNFLRRNTRGPVIVDVGSILDHSSAVQDVGEWPQVSRELRRGLQILKAGQQNPGPHFSRDDDRSLKMTVKASSSVLADVFSVVSFNYRSAGSLTVTIRGVRYEKLSPASRLKIEDLWKADTRSGSSVMRERPVLKGNGNLECWVVTEIAYASSITVRASDSTAFAAAFAAGVDAAPLAAAAGVPLLPNVVNAVQVRRSQRNNSSFEMTATGPDGRFPFGFKAVRLEYDPNGSLVERSTSMGTSRLHVGRSPDNRNSDSYMGDLFEDENAEDLEPLEIQTAAAAHRP